MRVLCSALLATVVVLPSAAHAGLAEPAVGPFIETGGGYEGQRTCQPAAKPGVLAFRTMVLSTYPNTGAGGIGRSCTVGGTSEHKEGRAWDWGVNAGVASHRAAAEGVLNWLTGTDAFGHVHSNARRVGIMYLIWNRRIFFPSSGWRTYCVQRNGACRDPEDGGIRHPHTDHVHFSFTWDGAYKRTTFWNRARSFAVDAAAHPGSNGAWVLGGNGELRSAGASYLMGDRSDRWLKYPAAAVAATTTGAGYWFTTRSGRVYAFGDALNRGSVTEPARIADMAAHPSGSGYWLVTRRGRIFSFGSITNPGRAELEAAVVGIEPTPTGEGAWVLAADGQVAALGDAQSFGGIAPENAISLIRTASGAGYWIVTTTGHAVAYGDAADLGSPTQSLQVVAAVPTPTRLGYYLVTKKGFMVPIGDAASMQMRAPRTTIQMRALPNINEV